MPNYQLFMLLKKGRKKVHNHLRERLSAYGCIAQTVQASDSWDKCIYFESLGKVPGDRGIQT